MICSKLIVTIISLISLIASVVGRPGIPAYGGVGGGYVPRPYQFHYYVNSPDYGNDFGHREESDGKSVQGQYYVLLPDGRKQTVSYTADDLLGFVADVKYEGGIGGIGGIGGYH